MNTAAPPRGRPSAQPTRRGCVVVNSRRSSRRMRSPTRPSATPKAIETRASRLWTALKAVSWAGSPTMFQMRVAQTQIVQAAAARSRVERARRVRMPPCYEIQGVRGGGAPREIRHRGKDPGTVRRASRRREGPRGLIEAERPCDVGLEDLAGALVQAHGPHEPGEALHAHLGHVAVAAEH